MGVPAISTNVSAIPELILDHTTGLIVPPSNSDEMADGILRLLEDSALRKKVIQEGQAYVRKEFNNKELTAKLGSVFQHETGKDDR